MKTWTQIIDPAWAQSPEQRYMQAATSSKFVICYKVHDESFINENLSFHKCNLELNAICTVNQTLGANKHIYYFSPTPKDERFFGGKSIGLTPTTKENVNYKNVNVKTHDFLEIEPDSIWIVDEEYGALSDVHRLLHAARCSNAWKILFFIKAQNLSLWQLLNEGKA